MKKIFSLALMATALLISGQVKAQVATVAINGGSPVNKASIEEAFDAVGDGQTAIITLLTSTNQTKPIAINGGKKITFDLNGKTLTLPTTIGDSLTVNAIPGKDADCKISKAELEKICTNIAIQNAQLVVKTSQEGGKILNDTEDKGEKFDTNFKKKDIHCFMVYGSKDPAEEYGYTKLEIKNGVTVKATYGKDGVEVYYVNDASGNKVGYGVDIIINGYVYGNKYGVQVSGNLQQKSGNVPRILIDEDANIECKDEYDKSTAIYCAGYAQWTIKGYVHGNIGVYVKSGEVDIVDAVVEATASAHNTITATGSGVSGGNGSAIVVESNKGYAGGQDVTISGDTRVSATSGLAIEEVITNTGGSTKVSQIDIQGGTFTVGNDSTGTMRFTNTTAIEEERVTIAGGNVTGAVHVDGQAGNKIEELAPSGSHVTEVIVDGKSTFVVGAGSAPAACADINAAEEGASIKLATGEQTLNASKILGELELNNYDQGEPVATKLTLADSVVLKVTRLTLNEAAQIIIPATSKIVVTGQYGIYAPAVSNLIIKANADGMGALVFSPDVKSNRSPLATMEYVLSAAHYDGTYYYFDMFSSPFEKVMSIEHNLTGYGLAYQRKVTGTWEYYTKELVIEGLKPFEALAITTNYEGTDPIVVTFTGKLQGNNSGKFTLKKGWNFIGNGFCAGMSMQSLLQTLNSAKSAVYPGVWMFTNTKAQRFEAFDMDDIEELGTMPATRSFLLYSYSKEDEVIDLDYEKLIWNGNK